MRIIAAGARWGKDTASLYELFRLAIDASRRPGIPSMLVPRVHCWIVGPTFPLLTEPWRVLKRIIPEELVVDKNESRMSLHLVGDVLIEFKSAERPESLVGSGLDVLVMLEAALIPGEAWTTSLRPRLASPGRLGLMIASGTPKGRNFFYHLWLDGQDDGKPDIWSMRAATWDNPLIDPDEIESMRGAMTARSFAQEVGGDFVSDEGAVFRGVRSCVVSARERSGVVCVGVDWGMRKDSTALVAVDQTGHVVGFDAFRRIPYKQIIARAVDFALKHGASYVIPESNGVGDPLCEQFENELAAALASVSQRIQVLPFLTSSASKRQVIDFLSLAIEQQRVTFPDFPRLINQLELYEFVVRPTGTVTFSAPAGLHDDAVIAFALALHGFAEQFLRRRRPAPIGVYVDAGWGGGADHLDGTHLTRS